MGFWTDAEGKNIANDVEVTGKYAFCFTTYITEHPWDGADYACYHDVNEEQGRKAFFLLEKKTGRSGADMMALLEERFGSPPDAKALFDFCIRNQIQYQVLAVRE